MATDLLEIDCSTGQINVSKHNFSGYKAFLDAGKSVNVDLSGEAACCASKDDCTILENKEKLAQQLLTLAQTYGLSGYTQDWEFGKAFNWHGYNETMAHVASVLAPHNIGLGISINSGCENKGYVDGSDPTCCPAYRDVPWAAVLTDMGTYGGPGDAPVGWMKNGTKGSCPPNPTNAPAVISHCGFEGNVMNMLHSPVATVHADRWPQLSPAMWIGDCYPNGSLTKHGWTHENFKAHLAFLDTVGIQRIGASPGPSRPSCTSCRALTCRLCEPSR